MVSHAMETIKDYCERAVLLVDGRMMYYDDVERAIEAYYRLNR